ncbi:hypothetical protein GCM10007933_15090 [Zoogloea oryzae]|uniref:Uncharacterized protein n=1 Tax=Zoogloea oryzae TaxID=310767 RepID=A0ABQ6F902_9RHOO|nr:hypothetical protein GCM10007933_15090 [Zoogloea oryzae]
MNPFKSGGDAFCLGLNCFIFDLNGFKCGLNLFRFTFHRFKSGVNLLRPAANCFPPPVSGFRLHPSQPRGAGFP